MYYIFSFCLEVSRTLAHLHLRCKMCYWICARSYNCIVLICKIFSVSHTKLWICVLYLGGRRANRILHPQIMSTKTTRKTLVQLVRLLHTQISHDTVALSPSSSPVSDDILPRLCLSALSAVSYYFLKLKKKWMRPKLSVLHEKWLGLLDFSLDCPHNCGTLHTTRQCQNHKFRTKYFCKVRSLKIPFWTR